MAKLIVLSGFSGSGKSTHADALHKSHAASFTLRSDSYHHCYLPGQDVTQFLIELAEVHLRHGVSVIVDAVNKHPMDRARWDELANQSGISMEWVDLDVPVTECITRDARRPRPVGAMAILAQAGVLSSPPGS